VHTVNNGVAPVITTNVSSTPPASQCANSGTFPELSVTATGAVSYQWYSNTSNSNTGGASISGAIGSIYFPPTTSVGNLYYYCIVTGTCNSNVTSNVSGVHTVTNSIPPVITTNVSTTPPTALCVNSGAFPALSIVATGAVSYQWYSNISNSNTDGTPITDATSASYAPPSTSVGNLYYYCVITGACGNVTSNVSGVHTVNANTVITTNVSTTTPAAKEINTGNFPELSIVATGANLTYQWYSNISNSNTDGTPIPDATTAKYAPPSTSVGSLYYYCIVTGTCGKVTSEVSGVHTVIDNGYIPDAKEVIITVVPCETNLMGTVFPFVRWNIENFDKLFAITINLKSVPDSQSADPLGDLINETPLHSTKAIYYNGSLFVPGSPETPGIVGALNNYGLPVDFFSAINVMRGAPITAILLETELPVTYHGQTLGLYRLENVRKGDYILEIKRDGFVTRWAKINVNANDTIQ
jgi:hypothetical protein